MSEKNTERQASETIGKLEYKRLITKMIEDINTEIYLQFIYNLLCSFKRKWGI